MGESIKNLSTERVQKVLSCFQRTLLEGNEMESLWIEFRKLEDNKKESLRIIMARSMGKGTL